MQMTLYSADLSSLSQTIQACLTDLPVKVQCAVREGHLIVLGQHPKDVTIDASEIFYSLERYIQTLHIEFTKQVRLYLRIIGERYPYAHSWFTVQPLLPTSQSAVARSAHAPNLTQSIEPQAKSKSTSRVKAWIDDENDDDSLLDRLSSFDTTKTDSNPSDTRFVSQSSPPTPATETPQAAEVLTLQDSRSVGSRVLENWQKLSDALKWRRSPHSHPDHQSEENPFSAETPLLPNHAYRQEKWSDRLDTRLSIALGITALGTLGGLYASSRSCILGACPELETAQALNQEISDDMQNAEEWEDLDSIQQSIQRGISLLEPIPLWSRHAKDSQSLLATYQNQSDLVEQLIAVEQLTHSAESSQQTPLYTIEDWVSVRSLWQSTIEQLKAISPDNDLFDFAQQRIAIHQRQLTQIERQIQFEEEAASVLQLAQSTAQLAQTRQQTAQSTQDWQEIQTIWANALKHLRQVPENSIAAIDAQRQLDFYANSLANVNQRLGNSVPTLESSPISLTTRPTEIEPTSNSFSKQDVEAALNQVCIGGSRFCRLLSVDQVIRVQLDLDYADALNEAQTSENRRLGAIATHHQTLLRESLKSTAEQFGLPLELYDSNQTLLEEFQPG